MRAESAYCCTLTYVLTSQIREGFIVEDEEDDEERERRRKERRKRRREEREEEEAGLDDEDLDLIGEANPELARRVQSEVWFIQPPMQHLLTQLQAQA